MLTKFILTLIIMGVLDILWIKMMTPFYVQQIGHLAKLKDGLFEMKLAPAVWVYTMMVVGLVIFVYPAAKDEPMQAGILGAMMGLVMYGVYEGTNAATLRDWPLKMIVVDTLWGMFLCGFTAGVVVYIQNQFFA